MYMFVEIRSDSLLPCSFSSCDVGNWNGSAASLLWPDSTLCGLPAFLLPPRPLLAYIWLSLSTPSSRDSNFKLQSFWGETISTGNRQGTEDFGNELTTPADRRGSHAPFPVGSSSIQGRRLTRQLRGSGDINSFLGSLLHLSQVIGVKHVHQSEIGFCVDYFGELWIVSQYCTWETTPGRLVWRKMITRIEY